MGASVGIVGGNECLSCLKVRDLWARLRLVGIDGKYVWYAFPSLH